VVGIIIQLIISWILLKIIEKQNLSALGLTPSRQHIKHIGIGLLIPLLFLSTFWIGGSFLVNNPFILNPDYTTRDFFSSTWYVLNSVLFEELIFRGAILYILMNRLGALRAIIISSVAFGIYHWFSFGLLGQPVSMLLVFVTTGLVGYVLALAFQKTRSMYLPIALHFGYNFTSMIILSTDKGIGSQLLIKTYEKDPISPGLFISISMMIVYFIGFPLLTYIYLRSLKPANSGITNSVTAKV
jgi:membrane protease YdiL (CAAX protease family)